MELIKESLSEFSVLYKWFDMLNFLEEKIIKENWNFTMLKSNGKNSRNPILENYIFHTFKRLAYERNQAETEEEKNKKIFIDNSICCWNTGLFTQNYKYIYACFEKNKSDTIKEQAWWMKGFYDDSNPFFEDIYPLPNRAKYINDISDLIYDTSLKLRVNISHILDNPINRERIPEKLREFPNLPILFEGAIELAKKKIEANYKVAIPQYYDGKMQLLIPINLNDMNTVDLALAVTRKKGYYEGSTCLTVDMAYNNARLIARPDSEWLRP